MVLAALLLENGSMGHRIERKASRINLQETKEPLEESRNEDKIYLSDPYP